MIAAEVQLSCRSPSQDDFAERPILDQMAQDFACLVEGIDSLDNRHPQAVLHATRLWAVPFPLTLGNRATEVLTAGYSC
jgi:hypothetical protein